MIRNGVARALDPGRVEALAEELSSRELAFTFVQTFLDMLPLRLNCIQGALGRNDAKAALEAVLSLKVSAAMTGATKVELDAAKIEKAIRAGSFPQANRIARGLGRDTEVLALALKQFLAAY